MPESELAKKITKLVKAADKLHRDISRDIERVLEAAKELKKEGDGEKKSL